MYKFVTLLLLSCFVSLNNQGVLAQDNSTDSIQAPALIKEIENQYAVRVFYKQIWLSNIKLPKTTYQSLQEALNAISAVSGYAFVEYDEKNYVYINKAFSGVINDEVEPIDVNLIKTIGTAADNPQKKNSRIQGAIKDGATGEPIIGATIRITGTTTGTSSNPFGNFIMDLPFGRTSLEIQSVGYLTENIEVLTLSNGTLDIEIFEALQELEEITIYAESKDQNISNPQSGLTKLNMKSISNMPSFLGDTDIIKSIVLLPGVNTVGEGSSGINVRGGENSQNLIMLDEIIIFNPSHLFGFFSAFPADLIEGVELYKGGIPSSYGGRLSSVLQVKTREGNMTNYKGKISSGIVTSRFSFEGPTTKNKGSFITTGRLSYVNWLMQKTKNIDILNSSAGFGDFSIKVNQMVSEKDKISASSYLSWDNFKLASDTTFQIQNLGFHLKWDHLFDGGSLGSLNLVSGKTNSNIVDGNGFNAFTMTSSLDYYKLKYVFSLAEKNRHKTEIGLESILYNVNPGNFKPSKSNGIADPVKLPADLGIENALFISDKFDISSALSVIGGIRFTQFSKIGPSSVYTYADGMPKNANEVIDTLNFAKNSIEKSYYGIEPRLSLKYSLTNSSSIKIGFNTIHQYLHLISNSTSTVPTDYWLNSNYHIRPQRADQLSIGLFKNLKENKYETSLEVYYKSLNQLLDYKEGGNILLNEQIETDLIEGIGNSYGTELFIRKNTGKLTGWISYTYSRSFRQFESEFTEETISNGNYFPSYFDKPHDLSIVGSYSFSKRVKLNWNFVYGSGRPITAPDGKYDQQYVLSLRNYSERNQYRIPDYHRFDLGLNIDENFKKNKSYKGSWSFSIYNFYARKNAFSVFFNQSGFAYKLSVLGTVFPSITYNITFE